jgi:hypothetical protein
VKNRIKKITITFGIMVVLLSSCSKKDKVEKINFNQKNAYSWSVNKFNLPTDWSPYNYLVLEIKASLPKRFFLELNTDHGKSSISVLPFQNARIQMAIPLQFYRKPNTEGSEMAALFSRSLTTGWFNIWGVNTGPLTAVDSIGLIMDNPPDNSNIEIYSITLTKEKPVEKVIEPTLLVDKFGQWIPVEWDNKIHTIKELEEAWSRDDSILNVQSKILERSKYGGFLKKKYKATGYFRTQKINNRWWFIDPDGYQFLATGVNGVSAGDFTRTQNRKYIFEEFPPKEFQRQGYDNDGSPLISLGMWNQQRRYGDNWEEKWKANSVKRLKAWGFNAINWSNSILNDKVVYAKFLTGWGIEEGVMGIPDVYSQKFINDADSVALNNCKPLKNDPLMLGYFLGNEPVWPGEESLVVDAILEGPDTKTKEVLQKFLKEGDTPERRKEFVLNTYMKFLKTIISAIRKYDNNHLIMGMRFGNLNISNEVIEMAKLFDVFSFNRYTNKLPMNKLDNVYRIVNKPILVGEFHFGVSGRGLAEGLVQVKNQTEKGLAYQNYVENAFAHPAIVGTFWYRWRDQMATGRSDGENYNIGVVDVTDLPYTEVIDAIIKTHSRVFDVHNGDMKPFVKE